MSSARARPTRSAASAGSASISARPRAIMASSDSSPSALVCQKPARIVVEDRRGPAGPLAQLKQLVDLFLILGNRDVRCAVARIGRQFVGRNVGKYRRRESRAAPSPPASRHRDACGCRRSPSAPARGQGRAPRAPPQARSPRRKCRPSFAPAIRPGRAHGRRRGRRIPPHCAPAPRPTSPGCRPASPARTSHSGARSGMFMTPPPRAARRRAGRDRPTPRAGRRSSRSGSPSAIFSP